MPWVLWRNLAEGELDEHRRLLQALNCLLVETPAGRVLIETGIGERLDEKNVAMRGYGGDADRADACARPGFDPASVDVVAMSHLHYDHAGGLLHADGSRAFPRARIVAQRQEWEVALGTNSPARGLVRPAGAAARRGLGRRGLGRGRPRAAAGRVRRADRRALGGAPGDRRARHPGRARGRVAFFGDLAMRPWSANPRWVTAFDDFPLDSVEVKGELFRRAVEDDWIVVLCHERRMPVGRLVPDRDRFRFEDL